MKTLLKFTLFTIFAMLLAACSESGPSDEVIEQVLGFKITKDIERGQPLVSLGTGNCPPEGTVIFPIKYKEYQDSYKTVRTTYFYKNSFGEWGKNPFLDLSHTKVK